MTEHLEQGSWEWKQARLGKYTASNFCRLMTNGRGTGTMGATCMTYMLDVMAERLTGRAQDEINGKALEWGHMNEPQARAMYCLIHGVRVQQVGFCVHPDFPDVGASPDGLVEGDPIGPGGVEIKCPMNSRIHLGYLEANELPKDYEWQVHGCMYVTGRKWWDFISFDPRMRDGLQLFTHRVLWDEEMMEDLGDRLQRVREQVEIRMAKVLTRVISDAQS